MLKLFPNSLAQNSFIKTFQISYLVLRDFSALKPSHKGRYPYSSAPINKTFSSSYHKSSKFLKFSLISNTWAISYPNLILRWPFLRLIFFNLWNLHISRSRLSWQVALVNLVWLNKISIFCRTFLFLWGTSMSTMIGFLASVLANRKAYGTK